MRVVLLTALLALSGCLDSPPQPETMLDEAVVEEVGVPEPTNETAPPTPRVLNRTGGYDMKAYGVVVAPHGDATAWQVAPGTPWIVEVAWQEEGPGDMDFHVLGDGSSQGVTGRSPLRMEFPDGGVNGTVEFQLNPSLRVASDVTYEIRVAIFEEAQFDPEWTALPP